MILFTLNFSTVFVNFNRQYRRDCLRALSADLSQEIEYMDNFAEDNPKNYQIWYHRRAVVEMLGDGSREMEFTSKVFDVDCKNYHAWAHRLFMLLKSTQDVCPVTFYQLVRTLFAQTMGANVF